MCVCVGTLRRRLGSEVRPLWCLGGNGGTFRRALVTSTLSRGAAAHLEEVSGATATLTWPRSPRQGLTLATQAGRRLLVRG